MEERSVYLKKKIFFGKWGHSESCGLQDLKNPNKIKTISENSWVTKFLYLQN